MRFNKVNDSAAYKWPNNLCIGEKINYVVLTNSVTSWILVVSGQVGLHQQLLSFVKRREVVSEAQSHIRTVCYDRVFQMSVVRLPEFGEGRHLTQGNTQVRLSLRICFLRVEVFCDVKSRIIQSFQWHNWNRSQPPRSFVGTVSLFRRNSALRKARAANSNVGTGMSAFSELRNSQI